MSQVQTRPYIGGQAVLEGVMMRSPRSLAVVVRRKSGELLVRERAVTDGRVGAARLPFVRGVLAMVEAVRLGGAALRFSSAIFERDLQEDEKRSQLSKAASHAANLLAIVTAMLAIGDLPTSDARSVETPYAGSETSKDAEQGAGRKWLSVLPIVFALGLFVALPQGAAALTSRIAHWNLDLRSPGFQALTGAFKLAIVVGYLALLRNIPQIRRMFQYHGAEHKTVSTYEAGEELLVAQARSKTTLHPRCGTTFMVMVALVSIFVFSLIGPLLPRWGMGGVGDNVLFFLLKLPFLPLIAAVTFEIQRLFARFCTRGPLRMLLWPGFLVQKVTTIEPDDDQLEVALAALQATLWRERGEAAAPQQPDRSFTDFLALSRDPGYGRAA